jgi:spore maturation protein CgeB
VSEIRVLLATMNDDYGMPERGRSYEHENLLLPLRRVYPGLITFDYMARLRAVGRQQMNSELIGKVRRERPHITIITMYTDQFEPATIREISRDTISVAYFLDDIWRTDYSIGWARHFELVTSPDPGGPERYRRAGTRNGIWSPFAFNEALYRRLAMEKEYEVSFIGGWHPYREWTHQRLRRSGIHVSAFGAGWPQGRVSTEEAVRIINASKINLNTWNGTDWELGYILSSRRALSWSLRSAKASRAVKGRAFEIAGCGGFQVTYEIPELHRYFRVGHEVVAYKHSRELLALVRRYLHHDSERERIADAGWRRAQADHRATDRMRVLVETALRRAGRTP